MIVKLGGLPWLRLCKPILLAWPQVPLRACTMVSSALFQKIEHVLNRKSRSTFPGHAVEIA